MSVLAVTTAPLPIYTDDTEVRNGQYGALCPSVHDPQTRFEETNDCSTTLLLWKAGGRTKRGGRRGDCVVGDRQPASRWPAPRSWREFRRAGGKGNGVDGRMVMTSLLQTPAAAAATAAGSGLEAGSPKRRPQPARYLAAPIARIPPPTPDSLSPSQRTGLPELPAVRRHRRLLREMGGLGRMKGQVSGGFRAARTSRGAPLWAATASSRCVGCCGSARSGEGP